MARNAEKAQAMLNRFLQAKKDALSEQPMRRPRVVNEVDSVPDCERWRAQVIKAIAKNVSIIQNGSLGEHKIRDLNDHINKLIREKKAWEKQIKSLGGPDYYTIAPKITDSDGKRAVGTDGYFYFGAAKELPGVRELLDKQAASAQKKSRADLYKAIDADYYGYRDDDDGLLVALEAKQEKKAVAEAVAQWRGAMAAAPAAAAAPAGEAAEGDEQAEEAEQPSFKAHVEGLPTEEEIQNLVLEKKKRDLLAKYGDASTAMKTD